VPGRIVEKAKESCGTDLLSPQFVFLGEDFLAEKLLF
jgi:hypothetical protein